MRGFILGSFCLIALQVFVSGKGPDQAAGILGWTTTALEKAISPDVALIPIAKTKATEAKPLPPRKKKTVTPGGSTGVAAI